MNLDEYIILIQQKFPYLFNDYGFRIVYKDEYRPGYEWFRVGLESRTNRILFAREQGGGVAFFGSLSAPFDKEVDTQWVSVINLLSYILKQEWDWSFVDQFPYAERPSIVLSFYAEKLRPMCPQIFKMFVSHDSISQWKPAYEQYLEEKFQRLYGSKKHAQK